jgi:signal transduction histidine kinase/ligand-binding sensor domain-containing protein
MNPRMRIKRNTIPRLWAAVAGLLALFLGILPRPAYAGGPGFYLVRQRGPVGPVRSVSVDRQGFVWSAGPGGTCRFDGLSTRCLSDDAAELVSASASGDDVWAVFSNGTLRRIFPTATPDSQWRIPLPATGLHVTPDRVWVSSANGLFVLEGGGGPQTLHTVATAPVDGLAGIDGGAVVALTGGKTVTYDRQSSSAEVSGGDVGATIGGVFAGADGGWLATTARDIWRADSRKRGLVRVDFTSALATPPMAVVETGDGALWLGVAGGLFHLPAGANKAISVKGLPFSSPNFAVTAIAASAPDRVWLATPVGLFEVQSRVPSITLNHRVDDDITIAFAVAPDSRGGVWFSSETGIGRLSGSAVKKYGSAEGLKVPDLRAVAVDGKGDVWAGGMGSGLFKLDTVQNRFAAQATGWPGGIRAILPSRAGGLWLGLSGLGLAMLNQSRAQMVLPTESHGEGDVLDMVEIEDGSLWVSFRSGGVASVRHGVVEHLSVPASFGAVELLSLLPDGEGGVLMGSNGKGLFRAAPGGWQQVTTQHGLADDHIHGLTTDHEGRLWFSSPRGLSYARRSDVNATLSGQRHQFHSVIWGREEGITGEPIRAFPKSAATLSDGTLAFPALDGLIRIDPSVIRAPAPPTVILGEIDFGAGSVLHELPAGIQYFRARRAQIRFAFSAPRHPRPHRLKFRFRLLGLETTWRVEAGRGEARYAGVPAGTYHFEVQALGEAENGGPGAVVSATVVILPPWYSTWAFRGLIFALAVFAMFVRHRQCAARASAIQDARAAERRRIAADIHDGLTQDLVGLRLQIEAAQASLQKDPGAAGKFLHRAGLLLEDGLKDLRDSIWGLNHDDVDSELLANGLRERLARSTQGTSISLAFESLGVRCLVTPAAAWQITQIARESVANAIKHAMAKQIAVTLSTTDDCIKLAVVDDGRGMDGAAARPGVGRGFGLEGMKARARALHAVLQIKNNPSGGTRIELTVPLAGVGGRPRPPV